MKFELWTDELNSEEVEQIKADFETEEKNSCGFPYYKVEISSLEELLKLIYYSPQNEAYISTKYFNQHGDDDDIPFITLCHDYYDVPTRAETISIKKYADKMLNSKITFMNELEEDGVYYCETDSGIGFVAHGLSKVIEGW